MPAPAQRPATAAAPKAASFASRRARVTAVDGCARRTHAGGGIGRGAAHLERERGIEDDRVAMRPAIATLEHRAQAGGVVRGVAAREVAGRAAGEAQLPRVAPRALDTTRPHVVNLERPHRRGLVPARLAVDDEHALDRHAGERVGHETRGVRAVGADQGKGRRGRVGQRPEQVEHGPYRERATHRRDLLHRRVIVRREEEGETGRLETVARRALVQRQRQAERFQQVGAPRAARHRAVAVLDDGHAQRRDEQRRARREIEASGAVAAGPDDVDRGRARRQHGLARERAHGRCEPAHFVWGDTLGAQRREQRARHRRRKRRIRERAHQVGRLGLGQISPVQELLEHVA